MEFYLTNNLDIIGFIFNIFSFMLHSPQFFLMSVYKYFSRNLPSPTSYFSCPQLLFNYSQVIHMLTTLTEKIEYLLKEFLTLYLKIIARKKFNSCHSFLIMTRKMTIRSHKPEVVTSNTV